MANQIVTLNVSTQTAPPPNKLQKTGALVSQGGTTTAPQTRSLITQLSDLTPLLTGAKAIASITWSGSIATVTTVTPHGFTIADTILTTIAGETPAGYNGTFQCTITGASTFTYPLVSNPGAATVQGVYTPEDVAELVAMATTFFAQGAGQAVYVLELGAGTPAEGVTALNTYILANPGFFYSYLVPRPWSGEATFLAFAATFTSNTAKTYFFVTMTTGNYTSFASKPKSIVGLIEAPAIPVTEFSLAAAFWVTLNYAPAPTNRVPPFCFAALFGVTPYPTSGNGPLLTLLKAANVNVVQTGAEGGLTNSFLFWGTTLDGRDFSYWYSVDWVQVNEQQGIAAYVIQGSNNTVNPLYYSQQGINELQGVAASIAGTGVAVGLILGTVVLTQLDAASFNAAVAAGQFNGKCVINAIPFLTYLGTNPADFPAGIYNGLTMYYSPNRGFKGITFNILVTDFVAQ